MSPFPDARLRRAGANRAQIKSVMEHYSGLDEEARTDFEYEVAAVNDARLAELVADLDERQGPAYEPASEPAGEPGGEPAGQPGGQPVEPPTQPAGEPGGEPAADRVALSDEDAAKVLETAKTVEAHVAEHPEHAADLAEREKAGRARKTVLALLDKAAAPAPQE